tara:strand:- start:332 stop:1012 length:681 start_codon:yes stop_codon:yes gene_type:complete
MDNIKFSILYPHKYIFDNFKPTPYNKYKHPFVFESVMKRCPGVHNYYNYGYVLPMWFDLKIIINDDKSIELIHHPRIPHSYTWHKEQIGLNIRKHFGDNFYPHALKLETPWLFEAPKNYILSQREIDHNYNNYFHILPGVQKDANPNISIIVLLDLNVPSGIIDIKAGDPLCYLQIFDETKLNIDVEYNFEDEELKQKNRDYLDACNLFLEDITSKVYNKSIKENS